MAGTFDYYIENRNLTGPLLWFYQTSGTPKKMKAGHTIRMLPWDCASEGEIDEVADNLIKQLNYTRKLAKKAFRRTEKKNRGL